MTAPVTHFPGPAPGACFAGSHSPRPPHLAPPTPQPVARLCSSASQLLLRSLTSHVRSSSATAPRLPDAGQSGAPQLARLGISRFPSKELLHMPGSSTTPGRSDLAMVRPKRVAFRARNSVGTRGLAFAAQWLAYALPYRRFVGVLTDANARLGAGVDRSSFIVVDLHPLLLGGLTAHCESSEPHHAIVCYRRFPEGVRKAPNWRGSVRRFVLRDGIVTVGRSFLRIFLWPR